MRIVLATALGALLACAGATSSLVAAAKPAASSGNSSDAEAVAHYRVGKKLFGAGKFAEALEALEASRALLPSPNTELLIGHCMRELGRKPEAMAVYESVLADAGARVRNGEARFKATLEEAGRWSAVLRVELGQVRVVVRDAPDGTTVVADGAEVASERDSTSGELRATFWHQPGAIRVTVEGEGRERSEELRVEAGQEHRLELALPAPQPAESPDAVADSSATGTSGDDGGDVTPPLATWITAGVGVVGFAFFAGFGAASASTATDLDVCAPRCPTDMQEQADEGARNQTIANVSLVVGSAALAAAGTIWLVSALTDDDDADGDAEGDADGVDPAGDGTDTPEVPNVDFGLRPGGVVLRGWF